MIKIIKNNFKFLKLMLSYSPSYAIVSILMSFFTLYDTYVSVIVIKNIIDSLTTGAKINEIILYLLITLGIGLIISLVNSFVSNIFFPRYVQGFREYIHKILFDKALSLDLEKYDDPDFYDDYIWSMNNVENKIFAVFSSFQSFLIAVINLIFLVTYIAYMDVTLIIFTVTSVVATIILSSKISKLKYKYNEDNIKPSRTISYVQRVFYLKDYAKDLRLTNIPNIIKNMFKKSVEDLKSNVTKHGKKITIWESVLTITTFICSSLGVMIYLTIKVFMQTITIGAFPSLFNANNSLTSHLNSLFKIIPSFYENNLYIEKFNNFMNQQPNNLIGTENIDCDIKKIEFNDVKFLYKNSSCGIENINLTIDKGDKIAIVGYNGSGKTTLINLLLRLYSPNSGNITLNNGKNINDYKIEDYLKKFCVVTQSGKLFAVTVAENIIFKKAMDEGDIDKINDSLRQVGLFEKVMSHPDKYCANYSKEFDENGLIFSGGEEQKLLISKIFATDAEFIIMDEPSSALDPKSEYEIFNEIFTKLKEKTIIFISHRLSTTTLANKIVVMENGRICEFGSHEELMKEKGIYQNMFKMQTEKYLIDSQNNDN